MKLALWLMNRFQVNTSLAGDLTEEWGTGRSALWLLWQTCVAIMSAVWAGLWHHKLRTFVAVATGWLGWGILMNAIFYLASPFPHFPTGLFLFFLRPILLGWVVGRLQPMQPLATALLFIATLMLVPLWFSRHSLDYGAVLLLGSILIMTTTVGGLLATRKPKSFPIAG